MNTPTIPAAGEGRIEERLRTHELADATAGPPEEEEPIPAMQRVLDNPFLLLFIGVTVPTVFYIIWGIMEIVSIPMAPR